jgi:preprotein translocase subunit SecD
LGLDLIGGTHLVYEVDTTKIAEADRDNVLNGLRDVIERRVNLFGVSEPQVYIAKSGEKANLVVELAGVKNVKDAIAQIGETPSLDFRDVEQNGSSTDFIPTNLDGRYISGAKLSFNPTTGAPEVSISFNEEGAGIFEKITEKNIGKPVAIFLDNNLIEMPTVQQKIIGGQAVISGKFTLNDAKKLVERFNAGALPAQITLINQQTVSPALGGDSLRKTIIAGLVGTLLVILFMIFYYGQLGVFASLALIIYIALTAATFKIIPVTMTLAGVAGFILTIGMAVDANILVFERMKEETKRGLSKGAAIEEGFRRAWPSIRDSNTSTIITAAILYFLTASFVRGFALTLFLGVIISLFSALTTTRLFLSVFYRSKSSSKS